MKPHFPAATAFTACALALTLAAPAAFAGPRASTSYAVTTEATDSGGRRATSANYTHDGSLDEAGGVSTTTAPARTAKHGFAAQLYDATGLTLTTASPNVNEGATAQLGAWLALDDSTFLSVAAANVTWSVLSGPLSGVSTAGLATAGVVFQTTPAMAQGQSGGFTGALALSIVNVNTDDFGIYAGDGLGDDWQVQYFGQGNPLAAPGLDPDFDGQTNLFEFTAGLVPTDPASVFRLRTETVPGQPSQGRIIFSPVVAGRTYTVRHRSALDTGTWTDLTGATQSDNGSERTITDQTRPGVRFYQVRVLKP